MSTGVGIGCGVIHGQGGGGSGGGDATPGGASDVILLENEDGILLEDGSSFIELE
jgi:hypothetical protein